MSAVLLPMTFFALLGLAFGSFGNVLVYRIHAKKRLTGRSACPSCHRILAWFELVPLVSFLVLRGKCRRCHRPISLRYPLVEFGTGLLFVFAFFLHPTDPFTAFIAAFVLYFLFLACVFDASYQQIPDIFTILIAILALLSMVIHGDFFSPLLGAMVMHVWFGGQWVLTRGRAVGSGDIFLATALGLWLGIRFSVMALVFSYMSGAIILLLLLFFRKISRAQRNVAFVPFLFIGILLTLFGLGDRYLLFIGVMLGGPQ